LKRIITILIFVLSISLILVMGTIGCSGCKCTHKYGEWNVTEPTCSTYGYKFRECTECGDLEKVGLIPLPHEFVQSKRVEPSCIAPGYITNRCSECGREENVILESKGHDFVDGIIEATCDADGYKIKTCSICSEIEYGEKIDSKGHDYSFSVRLLEACNKPYIDLFECSVCEAIDYRESDEIAPHYYETVSVIEATCLKAGKKIQECKYCKETFSEEIPKREHSYLIAEVNATCSSEGKIVRYCTYDGCEDVTILEVLGKAPHVMMINASGQTKTVYSFDGVVLYSDSELTEIITKKSCYETESGVHFRCDNTNCKLVVSATDHNFKDKNTATCVKSGEIVTYCVDCSFVRDRIAAFPLGHDDSDVDKLCYVDEVLTKEYALITGDSKTGIRYKCSRCKEYVPSTKHSENIDESLVACNNPQICTVCDSVIKSVDHVMPEITCVSPKGDGKIYCVNCKITALGEVTAHDYGNENDYPCRENTELTTEYYVKTGVSKQIAFKCVDCGLYVEVVDHQKSCADNEVTCKNPQVCTVCFKGLKTAPHTEPELKCVSTNNDGNYYCVVCNIVPMGKLAPHDYSSAVSSVAATCKSNAYTFSECACGKQDPKGFIEIEGSMLGHKIASFSDTGVFDCSVGHKLKPSETKCSRKECALDFTSLVSDKGTIDCLAVYNYFNKNDYLDDHLADPNTDRAGDSLVKMLLSCCSSTNYRFNVAQHKYSSEPYSTESVEIDGITYYYSPSNCCSKGDAVLQCKTCSQLAFMQDVLPINPNNHADSVYACNEHCSKCMPEGEICNLVFTLNVLNTNGEPYVVNNLPYSQVYNYKFLKTRVVKCEENGSVYYKFTEEFISQLESMTYFTTAEAAKNEIFKYEVDWDKFTLIPGESNTITVYKK